jgi:hypothetical protein
VSSAVTDSAISITVVPRGRSGKVRVPRRAGIERGGDDRLPVKDRSGETLFYVSLATAKRMLSNGRVTALGSKKIIRALQVGSDFDISKVMTISAYVGQKYSHKRETDQNPAGVWTMKRLSKKDRPLFRRVVLDCIAKAA